MSRCETDSKFENGALDSFHTGRLKHFGNTIAEKLSKVLQAEAETIDNFLCKSDFSRPGNHSNPGDAPKLSFSRSTKSDSSKSERLQEVRRTLHRIDPNKIVQAQRTRDYDML